MGLSWARRGAGLQRCRQCGRAHSKGPSSLTTVCGPFSSEAEAALRGGQTGVTFKLRRRSWAGGMGSAQDAEEHSGSEAGGHAGRTASSKMGTLWAQPASARCSGQGALPRGPSETPRGGRGRSWGHCGPLDGATCPVGSCPTLSVQRWGCLQGAHPDPCSGTVGILEGWTSFSPAPAF